MRLTAKPVFFGTPVLIAVGTFLLLWMLVGGGSGATGSNNGTADSLGFFNQVEWTVFGADGVLKSTGKSHNVVSDVLKEYAADAIIDSSTVTVQEANDFDNISLFDATVTGETGVAGLTANLIADIKDGVGGTNINPSNATVPTDGAVGVYTIAETFFCDTAGGGDCEAIQELELTQGAGTNGTADTVLGAEKIVNITLADEDSLAVTWTVTVN